MAADLTAFVFGVVVAAFLAGIYSERWRAKRARQRWLAWRSKKSGAAQFSEGAGDRHVKRQGGSPPLSATDQLRLVMEASFKKRRLLSKSEARVFHAAEKAIREQQLSWRVMAQVNLGEILSSPDPQAFSAVNSKRVDVLLVSAIGEPIAAIEYQGGGHFQGTAPARDAVKKEALRKAGIGYIEMTPAHYPPDLAREISRLVTHTGG